MIYEGHDEEKLPILHGYEGKTHHTLGNNSNSPYCHAKNAHIAGKFKAPHLANTKKKAKWGKMPHIDKKHRIFYNKKRIPIFHTRKIKNPHFVLPILWAIWGKMVQYGGFVP